MPVKFEIFSGSRDEPIWLETVEGLAAATERMNEYASQSPGCYFIFCVETSSVLAEIDTSLKPADQH